MTNSWAHGVSGSFDTLSDWTAGVPAAGSTALITAAGTYTVTSSKHNSVGVLNMAKNATLAISTDNFDITLGTGTGALDGTITVADAARLVLGTAATSTTFDLDTGSIDLQSGADATKLRIAGTVTLDGNGKINLSGDGGAEIVADGSAATLTNAETISGQGLIGGPLLNFVNAGKGIIDATTGGNVISIEANQFTNSGLLETTGSGDLFFGTDITQTARGNIKIDGTGAKAQLEFATITGGMVSVGAGAFLGALGGGGSSVLKDQTQPIANAGEIDATASSLIIEDSIKNTAGASLVVGNGREFEIIGAVTGGKMEIQDTGQMILAGPSSANVTFSGSSPGLLELSDATKFTGTVAGMLANPGSGIELFNIAIDDNPAINFHNHVLTVSDPITHVTDTIKISGAVGAFSATGIGSGNTLITDPPPSMLNRGAQLLTQAIASFGASSGIVGPGTGNLSDNLTSSNFLASNTLHHHG